MLKEDKNYEIPIERLGLSVKAINGLKRLGLFSIGDCIDCYIAERDNWMIGLRRPWYYHDEVKEKLSEHGYWKVSSRDFTPDMLEELKQALIEKGYWSDTRPHE